MAISVLRTAAIWSGTLLILAPTFSRAEVVLAPIFSDGIVLQRNEPIRIWGTAEAGEKVAVEFDGSNG
jgi:sialate O-acetylesterase